MPCIIYFLGQDQLSFTDEYTVHKEGSNSLAHSPHNNLNDNSNHHTMSTVKGFVVPPLQPGDRISDWEPIFKAAVTPLLAQDNGQTLAIGLLPAHVNRRTAEKELVQEAIQKTSLDEAFTLLKTLDDPIDPYEAMQKLCRRNWLHGTHIDDFFYDLKRLAKDAAADANLICNIMIAQLPKTVQQKVKEDFATKKGTGVISDAQRFKVIKSRRPIKTILGRDFLFKFGSTEFDWVKGQIRLGEQWITPLLWMRGGTHNDRVAVAMSSSGEEMKFDINPNLDDSQRSRLQSLLEEFSDCFAENPKKPTATSTGTHIIETVQGARPHKAKRYRMSPQQEEETNRQAEEMLRNGIIRPSNSPWAHNVILVKKRDGSTQFVIDYRPINEVTIKDSYPMPNIREIVDKMKGSKYFCKMDMASAYWSVPIKEEDREKTAFMTPRGLYEMCHRLWAMQQPSNVPEDDG